MNTIKIITKNSFVKKSIKILRWMLYILLKTLSVIIMVYMFFTWMINTSYKSSLEKNTTRVFMYFKDIVNIEQLYTECNIRKEENFPLKKKHFLNFDEEFKLSKDQPYSETILLPNNRFYGAENFELRLLDLYSYLILINESKNESSIAIRVPKSNERDVYIKCGKSWGVYSFGFNNLNENAKGDDILLNF